MTPDKAVSDLVLAGAAVTPTIGGVPVPVGLMQRIGPKRWFWFAAGGETEFDAHVISGDEKILYGGKAVEFRRGEDFAGYLTSIDESFDDSEAAARAQKAIEEWRARYYRDEALRGFVFRQVENRRQ